MRRPSEKNKRFVRLRHSIQIPLGLGALAIVWVAFAVCLGILASQDEREFSERHASEARRISALITDNLSQHMLAGGGSQVWNDVSAEAHQLGRITGALRILVIARDGLVKAASDAGLAGTRMAMNANPACPGCDSARLDDFPAAGIVSPSGEARRLRLVNAIPVAPECRGCHASQNGIQGYVSMDFDLSVLDVRARQQRISLLWVELGTGVVLLVLMAVLFRRLVMRSIDSLIVGAQRLGSGDLSARVQVVGNDELSLLARQFNLMAARLESQVARVQDANTESNLLYTLVVEASKNLEMEQVVTGVSRVVLEKLRPRHIAFFLSTVNGQWICAYGGEPESLALARGEGALEDLLAADSTGRALLDGVPKTVLEAARRDARSIRVLHEPDGFAFAVPVASEAGLIGLLACCGCRVPVTEELLGNLGAHLALAAANSRNYAGAITDSLTGLKNQRYGIARLEEAVLAARRHRWPLAVAMCDIDHFKRVNDERGHPAGDAVLREVSRRIGAAVRKSDTVVRYAGEEFLLILPQAAEQALVGIAEKVRASVAQGPVAIGDEAAVSLTLSVGVTAFRRDSDSRESLLERADSALYRAKQSGRDRVELL